MQKNLINFILYINKKFFFKREHPFNISKNGVLDLNYSDFEYMHSKGLFDMYSIYYDINKLKNKKVLDIGCGAGGKAIYMAKNYNNEVAGIDLNEVFLQQARDFALENGVENKVVFKRESALELNFLNESFDVIIMSDVIEHIPNTKILFREALRVLKKGGVILFDFASYYHFFGHHLWDSIQIPWLHLLTSESFRIKLYEESVKNLSDGQKRIALRIGIENNKRGFTYLNKIKRKDFEKIIKDLELSNNISLKIKYKMLKNINLFSKIPFLREAFIKHIVGVITKN